MRPCRTGAGVLIPERFVMARAYRLQSSHNGEAGSQSTSGGRYTARGQSVLAME